MWIAPSRYPEIRNWTSEHWIQLDLSTEAGWKTAIEIFEDRIQYRYLDAVQVLKAEDDAYYRKYVRRRFGFAIMALDCLLLETLAQFYEGLKDSDQARNVLGLNNTRFYVRFLSQSSFVLQNCFDKEKAELFYRTIRCGILHQAETKYSTLIRYVSEDDRTLPFEATEDQKGLCVYWARFHELVLDEYEAYCNCLRGNVNAIYRENFVRKMEYICRIEEA